MNWKFWQKKPAGAVEAVEAMDLLESSILDSLDDAGHPWALRDWKDETIRADRGGVTIVSSEFQGFCKASCAAHNFGPVFARAWHRSVRSSLDAHKDAALKIERAKVLAVLKEEFEPA